MATDTAPDNVTNAAEESFEQLAQAVDRALEAVQELEEPARGHALALKDAIEAFHRVGLSAIIRTIRKSPDRRQIFEALAEQPEVFALFTLHGLVRSDLGPRVSQVLELVRPYIQSHGGDVTFEGMRGRTVLVRLHGACQGCSMSPETLRETVEQVLRERVPEIDGVESVEPPPNSDAFVSVSELQVIERS